MANTGKDSASLRKAPTRYHHGDLRMALTEAAERLVREKGVAAFTTADACKAVGVTPAALYRHFENREAVLNAIAIRGFVRLEAAMRGAKRGLATGSLEAINAVGVTYFRFALDEPEVFQLCCGRNPAENHDDAVHEAGMKVLGVLLEEIAARTGQRDEATLLKIGLPMWTFVHGAAQLASNDTYSHFLPDFDIPSMISDFGRRFLTGQTDPGEP